MINWAGLVRFESPDGTHVVTFSQRQAEWSSSQSLQVGIASVHGADYGYDPWGGGSVPVNPAEERWRALVPNDDVDVTRSRAHSIGRGRLFIRLHDETERWAWARLNAMPDIELGVQGIPYVPLILPFTRLSDWFAAEATVVEETVTGNTSFIVESAGLAVTRNIVITLTANSAGGFDQPTIANGSTVESFTIDRVAVAGEVVRIDVEAFRMEHDVGNGMEDVTEDLKLGGTQVMPISLIGGNNLIEVTGITDSTVRIEFYDAWR